MNKAIWTTKHPKTSNMWQFMRFVGEKYQEDFKNYEELHLWSINNINLFWPTLCDFFNIQFDTKPSEIINNYTDMIDAQWFIGAKFNFAEKSLSRDDDHIALISLDEQGSREILTYKELKKEVSAVAAGLKAAGVVVGDRIGAVMPNCAKTIIAMLATTSLGAIWASCSTDFGAEAAIDRLGQIEPKLLFVSDSHQYHGKVHNSYSKIKQIISSIPSLTNIVVCSNNKNIDISGLDKTISLDDFKKPGDNLSFVSLPFSHPVYILFSSGTTGIPKCIIHSAGGTLLQHIKELGLHTDMKASDNLCFYTTCGWMMWNWMVSSLALGATLTLYDGSPAYPDSSILFRIIDEEKVSIFGTSAKFISAVEKEGIKPKEKFKFKNLRSILSTGSPLLPNNYDFVYQNIKADLELSSISGGTDIISCFALGNPMLPVYRGEIQCLGLGMSVEIYNEDGKSLTEERGELVCTKPFPSMPIGFWQDPDKKRYRDAYFNRFTGAWVHGDFAEITEHHGLIIYGRSDATLNPGGVRIGTAEIYRQVEKINGVIDSVVIGQDWQNDVRIVLFVKLNSGKQLTQELKDYIRSTIKQNASPRHIPAKILEVKDIPRTISGKTVEIAVRQAVHGQKISNLQSLANPEALDYFKNREELKS